MMPTTLPRVVPAPQEWSLAVHFSPFQAMTRLAEMQVGMTMAAAELAIALSPIGLSGAVGRRAVSPAKAVSGGSVVPMVRPRIAAVPPPSAPKPVPVKPRPVRPAVKKAARPAVATLIAPKSARSAPKLAAVPPAPVAPASVAEKGEASVKPPVKAKRAPKAQAKPAPGPEPKSAAPKATPAPAPQPAADPARPRARRTPAKPTQPFKVEE